MKFQILSDTHLEINKGYKPKLSSDIDAILCAGDMGRRFFKEYSSKKPLISCVGNHFYYDSRYKVNHGIEKIRGELDNNTTFLDRNNNFFKIDDYLIIGCTLWTGFSLYGDQYLGALDAKTFMNDYNYIRIKDGDRYRRVEPLDIIEEHKKDLEYLKEQVKNNQDKKIIIVTHHAPSILSCSERYKGGQLNPCYFNKLESFILDNPCIKLFVHGHVHNSVDYNIGGCRIVCNPKGYGKENHDFKEEMIVEV